MPNTGRPSKDCHLCRARRVKCDLARPSCQRCIKYGAECPGYRDQQDLMFRNADPTAVKKRRKRVKASPPASSSSSSSSSSPVHGDPLSSTTDDNYDLAIITNHSIDLVEPETTGDNTIFHLPPRSLGQHWTAHSVPIVLSVYSTLHFLNDLYSLCPPDGPLVWVAHLFARTYVTNLQYPTAICSFSVDETQSELGKYLGKTLSAVGQALSSPGGALRDDILATIWMLSNYELLVGSVGRMGLLSPWNMHARGLCGILKARGVETLRAMVGRTTFWSAFNIVQIEAIVSANECPPESVEWLDFIRTRAHEDERLALAVSTFMYKAASVQSRMLSTLRRGDYQTAADKHLTWIGDLTSAENAALVAFTTTTHPPDTIDAYFRDIYLATTVKVFHTAQLHANFLTHYRRCPIPREQLEAQRVYCLQRVRDSAEGILDSACHLLNPGTTLGDKSPKALLDAIKMVWPLTSVYASASTLPNQKAQAELALWFIGRELGVRQALRAFAEISDARVPDAAQAPLGFGGARER